MRNLLNEIFRFSKRFRKTLIFSTLILLFLLPLIPRNPFYQDLVIMIFFWGTLASAWNLLGGFAGQISLGHAAFFGIGAYTSTILYLTFGLSPWLGMFVGAGLSIIFSFITGYPCFRLTSHFFALATIALGEVLRLLASYWRGLTNGGVGLLIPFEPSFHNFIFKDKIIYSYIILVMLLIIILVTYILKKRRFGYYLVALKEDQNAAESLCVNTHRYKMIALIISAFFTSIAGSFYAQYFAFIDPDIVFSLNMSIQLALLSIIGGIGTVFGPIMGACFLVPLDVFLRGWLGGVLSGLNFVVYGVILIVAVMYFPFGIVGWIKGIINKTQMSPSAAGPTDNIIGGNSIIIKQTNLSPKEKSGLELLSVNALSKHFGGLQAVKDLTFTVNDGEILGLIGPNGAGKTTLFNLISGFIAPDSGVIKFRGENISSLKNPHRFCQKAIGRTFQLVKPFQDMTVLENVMVGTFARMTNTKAVQDESLRVLNRIQLSHHAFTKASNLTIADRKRLELGRSLATKPKLLLLDEVMAGLNPKETEDFVKIIKSVSEEGITIIMIEHVMKAVMALSDRVIVINHGIKLAEGYPEEIVKNRLVVDAYLGGEYDVPA